MPKNKIFIFLFVLLSIGAFFYLIPRENSMADYIEQAEDSFQAKDFSKAISFYLKAYEKFPHDPRRPEVMLAIGDIYNFSLNQPRKAAKAYTILRDKYPKHPKTKEGLLHAAEMYEKTEDYQNALISYQEIIDQFQDLSDRDELRFKVALMAVKLKKFEPARRELMGIIDKNPQTPIADKVLFHLGTVFFMENGLREAIQVFELASEKYPNSPYYIEMQFLLGNCYEEVGEYDKALKVYRGIRDRYPNPSLVEKRIEKLTRRPDPHVVPSRSRIPQSPRSKSKLDKTFQELMKDEP